MIEALLKKFGGRFTNHFTTHYNSTTLLPTYSFKDLVDGEVFTIQIDSFAADPEIVIENILREKVIYKRDKKISHLIDGTQIKKNR